MHLCGGHPSILSFFAKVHQSIFLSDFKTVIKHVNCQCMTCSQYNNQPKQQQMASLPALCLAPLKPFLHRAADCGGGISYTPACMPNGATLDGYFLVCMCLCTRAIHLEMLASLLAADLLLVFQVFAARSGTPRHIYSDHLTNFISLTKPAEAVNNIDTNKFKQCPGHSGVSGHFIHANGPNFNGNAEAAVKSAKH
jgi:hypothetical protein